jgi:hypothetical protein
MPSFRRHYTTAVNDAIRRTETEKADPPTRPAHALAAGAQGGAGRLALEQEDGQGKGPPDVEEQAGGKGGQQEEARRRKALGGSR